MTNPTGAVEYTISGSTNYQSSNLFVAPAGTYTLTAREVSNPLGCIVNTTIVITEPDSIPTTVVSIIEPTCTNSLATVTVTSDTLGLTIALMEVHLPAIRQQDTYWVQEHILFIKECQ
ncbi:MAG: hypothetical protein HWD58_11185 [Bacteroidota bacterium]|nr:MAG: hypothetical protein HWD58_11185 [Bacteroidota bacterium]